MYNSTKLHRFNTLLKRELSILLKQSSTYISFILLTIICGLYFFIFTGFFTNQTCDLKYFFSIFPYICIIAIPCLSFNIFKNENFYNSVAVNDLTKIFAKFLSLFIIYSFSILVSIIIPIQINLFGQIELAQFFIGYFSILSYGLLVISLSIFVQTIFKNKIASLILTVFILFIFNSIHIIPKYININDGFLLNLLQNISFAWHYDSASKGIFNTKDFSFYIILSILFIFLSSVNFQKQQDKKISRQSILIILILIFLFFDTTLFYTKIDFTKSKKYSLTNQTEEIIKNISTPINITYAYSPELANLNSQINEIQDFLKLYSDLSNNINLYFEKVTENSEIKSKLKNFEITPLQIETENSLNKTTASVYSSIILETENNYKIIPFAYSTNQLEYMLTSNILALETNQSQSVIVLVGNNLSIQDDYFDIVEWLKFLGFNVFTEIKIADLKNTNIEIPVLLLGTSNLKEEDCIQLESEFFRGRKLLTTTSPNNININTDWFINNENKTDYFIQMINQWGIFIENNLVLDKSCYEITLKNSNYPDDYQTLEYPFWIKTQNGIFYWPSPITYQNKDFSAKILQKSSELSWLKNIYTTDGNFINTSPLNEKNLQPQISSQGEYILACEFNGEFAGKYNSKSVKNKFILISDQYFTSKMINYTNNIENLNFTSDLLLNLTQKDFLIELKNKSTENYAFTKISDISQLAYLSVLSIFLTIFIPVIIIICVLVIIKIYNRKKKI